jgi:chromosome partitioning protein
MKRILVCSPKGGCGKTTISRNLAVAAALDGLNVGTIDFDPQGTLTRWWNRRGDNLAPITHYQLQLSQAAEAIQEVTSHTVLIMDTPTAIEEHPEDIKTLLFAADFVLIPTKATIDDIESTHAWMTLVKGYGRPFSFVINMLKPRVRAGDEVKKQLIKSGGRVCHIEIGDHEDLHRIATKGMGIMEVPRHPGRDEIEGVWGYIKTEIKGI